MRTKRKIYIILSVTVILILLVCADRFILTEKKEENKIAYNIMVNESLNMFMLSETTGQTGCEEPLQENMEERREFTDKSLADYFEGWTVKIHSDEERIQKILKKNQKMISQFFESYPVIAERWADFFKFDFTGDGQKEIVLSLKYIECSGVISYNYVYDGQGDMMMRFIAGDYWSENIYEKEDEPILYICERIHLSSDQEVKLYVEIDREEKLDSHFKYIEWEVGDSVSKEHYLYDDFSKEEEESMWQNYWDGMYKVFQEKETEADLDELKQYIQSIEKLEVQEAEYEGCVY